MIFDETLIELFDTDIGSDWQFKMIRIDNDEK